MANTDALNSTIIIKELSNDIKNMFELAFEKMENIVFETDEEALFRIEQCKIYLSHYGCITKATNCLNTTMNLLGLEHSLVGELKYYHHLIIYLKNIIYLRNQIVLGAMEKRTKFQVKELAQLTLNVNSHKRENNSNLMTSHECCDLPKVSIFHLI